MDEQGLGDQLEPIYKSSVLWVNQFHFIKESFLNQRNLQLF